MSGTVRRRQDFSDIDHLDRATEAFLREQRKALEERRYVRAPRTAPLWIQSHWKQAIVTAALVLVGGLAVFAGVKLAANGRAIRQPEPETTQSAEAVLTSAEQTESEKTEAGQASEAENTDEETKGSTAVTTAPKTTEKTNSEERTNSSSAASSATTRRTESTSGSQSSSETSRLAESRQEKPAMTTVQRGGSGVKAVSSSATTRTTARQTSRQTTTTTTRTTTRTTARTTASTSRQTTAQTTQTTPRVTEAPKAVPAVDSVKISEVKRTNGGYQHRVTVQISNPNSTRFDDLRTFYLHLPINAIKSGCVSGSASMSQTTGSTVSFYYGGPLSAGGKVSIVFLIVTDRPMSSATCTLG